MHSAPAHPRPDPIGTATGPPRWDVLMMVTAALLLVSQARVHVFIPGVPAIRPGLLLLIVGLIAWFARPNPLKRLPSPWPLEFKLAVFIFVWAGVGVPFGLWAGQSARTLLNILAPTLLVFTFIAVSVRHHEDVRRLLMMMGIGGAIFAVVAPIQERVQARGFGGGGYDPNDAAMFMVSILPVLVYFAVSARRIFWRIASGGAALVAVGGIATTESRGGFLALAAVLIFVLLFYRGVSVLTKTVAVAVVVLGLVATADTDYWNRIETISALDDGYGEGSGGIGGRTQIWTRGAEYMADNPLTGVGLNNFSVAEGQHPVIAERIRRGIGTKYSAAHSTWVQIGAELGLPALFAFLLLFGSVSRRMWRLSRQRGRWRPASKEVALMASTILGMLIGLAVAGTFLSNAYWSMVWAPLALGMMLAECERRRQQRLVQRSPARRAGRFPAVSA